MATPLLLFLPPHVVLDVIGIVNPSYFEESALVKKALRVFQRILDLRNEKRDKHSPVPHNRTMSGTHTALGQLTHRLQQEWRTSPVTKILAHNGNYIGVVSVNGAEVAKSSPKSTIREAKDEAASIAYNSLFNNNNSPAIQPSSRRSFVERTPPAMSSQQPLSISAVVSERKGSTLIARKRGASGVLRINGCFSKGVRVGDKLNITVSRPSDKKKMEIKK